VNTHPAADLFPMMTRDELAELAGAVLGEEQTAADGATP